MYFYLFKESFLSVSVEEKHSLSVSNQIKWIILYELNTFLSYYYEVYKYIYISHLLIKHFYFVIILFLIHYYHMLKNYFKNVKKLLILFHFNIFICLILIID